MKNELIREKLDVYSCKYDFYILEIQSEDNSVLVSSEIIADAWIKEINKLLLIE